MADYAETTLEQFKDAALGHVEGRKTSVTITYKGLSSQDRREARRWMSDQVIRLSPLVRAAEQHLLSRRASQLKAEREAWEALYRRLYVTADAL